MKNTEQQDSELARLFITDPTKRRSDMVGTMHFLAGAAHRLHGRHAEVMKEKAEEVMHSLMYAMAMADQHAGRPEHQVTGPSSYEDARAAYFRFHYLRSEARKQFDQLRSPAVGTVGLS